jgi:flagellar hook-basal body complex protein FliE
MDILSPAQVSGSVVNLAVTNPAHIGVSGVIDSSETGNPEQSFGNLLINALGQVNDSQVKAMGLTQTMITNPDSVDVTDVVVALSEANLAIQMTKAIVDRALTAYRDIINVR